MSGDMNGVAKVWHELEPLQRFEHLQEGGRLLWDIRSISGDLPPLRPWGVQAELQIPNPILVFYDIHGAYDGLGLFDNQIGAFSAFAHAVGEVVGRFGPLVPAPPF